MAKTKIVERMVKEIDPEEKTKIVRVKIPMSKYNNLVENAKRVKIKPDQLVLIAAEETDIFDNLPEKEPPEL